MTPPASIVAWNTASLGPVEDKLVSIFRITRGLCARVTRRMPPFGVLVRLLKGVFLVNIIEYCHVVKNIISSISHVHYPHPSTAPNRRYI